MVNEALNKLRRKPLTIENQQQSIQEQTDYAQKKGANLSYTGSNITGSNSNHQSVITQQQQINTLKHVNSGQNTGEKRLACENPLSVSSSKRSKNNSTLSHKSGHHSGSCGNTSSSSSNITATSSNTATACGQSIVYGHDTPAFFDFHQKIKQLHVYFNYNDRINAKLDPRVSVIIFISNINISSLSTVIYRYIQRKIG